MIHGRPRRRCRPGHSRLCRTNRTVSRLTSGGRRPRCSSSISAEIRSSFASCRTCFGMPQCSRGSSSGESTRATLPCWHPRGRRGNELQSSAKVRQKSYRYLYKVLLLHNVASRTPPLLVFEIVTSHSRSRECCTANVFPSMLKRKHRVAGVLFLPKCPNFFSYSEICILVCTALIRLTRYLFTYTPKDRAISSRQLLCLSSPLCAS